MWVVPQKGRHSGRDDNVGGTAEGRGTPVGMTMPAAPLNAGKLAETRKAYRRGNRGAAESGEFGRGGYLCGGRRGQFH